MAENTNEKELSVEELKALLAAERAEKEKALQVITQQSEQIADLDAQKGASSTIVTVNKEKYEVVIPSFKHAGKLVTAADIKKDADLAKELVKMGSGALVKVETSK